MKIEKLEVWFGEGEQVLEGFRGILILPKGTTVDTARNSIVYSLSGWQLPDSPVHDLRVVLVEEMGEGEDYIIIRNGNLII